MSGQTRAEWLKLTTVASTWVTAALATLVEIVLRVVGVLVAPNDAAGSDVLLALRPSIVFSAAVALLPAVLATGEWRHGTAVTTYALQPARARVLRAKILVGAATGAVVGLALGVAATAAGLITLEARSLPVPGAVELTQLMVSAAVSGACIGILALSVGLLVHDQNITVALLLSALFVIPLPAALLSPALYAWTPSGLVDGLAGLHVADPMINGPLLSGLTLVALAGVLVAVAAGRVGQRDVV